MASCSEVIVLFLFCSCSLLALHVQFCWIMEACIYLKRAFQPVFYVAMSVVCLILAACFLAMSVVCLIVAFLLLRELHELHELP